MSSTRLFLVPILLLCGWLALPASGRIIQVPFVSSDETLYMRLDQLHSTDKVFKLFGKLDRVYDKEALLIVDGNEVAFPVCYEQPPEAIFKVKSERRIVDNVNRQEGVIYDFEQVKYPRNLIDIETNGNDIYYVQENGVITVATLSQDLKSINATKEIQTEQTNIAIGNLVILPDATNGETTGYGLLVTKTQAVLFDLKGQRFTAISTQDQMAGFESAYPIEGNFFAGAYGTRGVKIFSIDFASNKLKLEGSYDQTNLKAKVVNIQDLAYDSKRKILFILDHGIGVIPVQLTITGSTLKCQLTSSTIKNNYCNVIYYDSYSEDLYLNCRELHRYRISNWPLFTEKILPRQEISIKEITSNRGIVALVGRNIFQLISEERKAAVYNDQLLDKLLLKDKFFISGNEHYLLAGSYSVSAPSLMCVTSDQAEVGKHKVLFKVTAECNLDYFKEIQFAPGVLPAEDRCVYSVYHTVKIWKPKPLNVKIFMILGLMIGAIGMGILIWWGVSYVHLRRLKTMQKHYQALEEDQSARVQPEYSQQPPFSIEMKQVQAEKASDKDGRHELNEEPDVPSDIHDIE